MTTWQSAGSGEAVQAVLSALAPKIEASTAEFDEQAIAYSLFGLQSAGDSNATRAVLKALVCKRGCSCVGLSVRTCVRACVRACGLRGYAYAYSSA